MIKIILEGNEMKLIHLSDFHIGKRIYGFSMLEDQKYILQQILQIIEKEQADGVLIAGDLYDKGIPPAEAVQVFDKFLTQLAELNIPVMAISGNHDSPERIAFGASLLQGRKVYLSPVYDGNVCTVTLKDSFGEVTIYMLPFLKPSMVRHALEKKYEKPLQIESYQEAVEAAIKEMNVDKKKRNVLIAHQFATGAKQCESEELQIGGVDQISVDTFEAFDYVALGHLHSPQKVGRDTVRYCGTPLKYSFSEAEHEKAVTVVTLLEKGTIEISHIPLVPLKDMRKIKGTYVEITSKPFLEKINPQDYVQIILTDEEDVPDGLQKLRIFYPNLMCMEYDNKRTKQTQEIDVTEEIEQKSEIELFEELFVLQNNQPMSQVQKEFAKNLIEKLREGGC